MKRIAITTAMMLAVTSIGFTGDEPGIKSDQANPPKSKVRFVVHPPSDQRAGNQQLSADELAIRATGEAYVAAFRDGNAKDAAAQFTTDAEYVDCEGTVTRGRDAIEKVLAAFFTANPGCKLDLDIASLRFVSPGVALEDGFTTVVFAKDSEPLRFNYTAVHVNQSGKWLTASVREQIVKNNRQHRTQLKQLEWLIGDWVHEGNDAVVYFSCRPVDHGNFLARNFTVHMAGQETMTGTQRIGWDPRSGKFRAWVFDSDGGYAEGYWHQDADSWVLKLTGVTPDGQAASNTSIYRIVDPRTMTFQSIDHEVAGVELPDSEPVTIVRQLAAPE